MNMKNWNQKKIKKKDEDNQIINNHKDKIKKNKNILKKVAKSKKSYKTNNINEYNVKTEKKRCKK